jgi:hypothetical protein
MKRSEALNIIRKNIHGLVPESGESRVAEWILRDLEAAGMKAPPYKITTGSYEFFHSPSSQENEDPIAVRHNYTMVFDWEAEDETK